MLDLDNTIKIPISRFFRLSRLTTDSSSSRFPKSKIISKIFFLIRLEKIVAHGGSGIEAAKAIPFATVNYRSNSPSISETWARAIGPSSLGPFTPHCIERRISRYGYHSSVANSTPGTVAGIGSACAQAALIYLPPFPILSLRHTDLVPADILLSQPMLPNPLSRDQIAYRHRLPRITNDARPSLPVHAVLFLAQFRPGDHLCRFSAHWVIGRRERLHCCRGEYGRVYTIISLWCT